MKKMSSNISKWFPRLSQQPTNDKVFMRTRCIERELKILANKFTTNISINLLDYYVSYMLSSIKQIPSGYKHPMRGFSLVCMKNKVILTVCCCLLFKRLAMLEMETRVE